MADSITPARQQGQDGISQQNQQQQDGQASAPRAPGADGAGRAHQGATESRAPTLRDWASI
jgi:hypothetical protein